MKNVLIVDDEQEITFLLSTMLKSAGYHVRSALDVESAATIINQEQFHKVFLDVNLGEDNGLSLIPAIQRHNPQCEVVVISAQDNPVVQQVATTAGAKKFILKPFSKMQILEAV